MHTISDSRRMPFQIPAASTARTTTLLLHLGMFLAAYLFSAYLPEQFFRDQSKLVDSLETDGEGIDSFRATAATYAFLTFGNPELLIPVCALAYILLLARFTTSNSAMIVAFFLFVPSLFLNLVVLGKETLVIAMSSLITVLAVNSRSQFWPLLVAVTLYLSYGFFIRPYYLAIIGTFIFLLVFMRCRPDLRILLALFALTVFVLLPAELYSLAAVHREDVNNYALFRGTFDIRTMVGNLVIPGNPVEFMLNYGYSLLILNFPVLFFHGTRDAIITLTNVFILYLIGKGIRRGGSAQRLMALLLLSHLLILCLFEPDVGSYSRHLLSASIYAALSLPLLPRLRYSA